jgi:hypothetical protein
VSGFDLIITPDQDDEDAALMFADGTIGERPYRFLLDTGSARTCVQNDDYTSSFPIIGMKKTSGVFAAETHDELIMVPRIEVGPIAKTNFPVARIASLDDRPRNLIGMDLLKDVACHVLFDEHRVVVDPQGEPTTGSMQPLFLDRTSHPYLDVRFRGTMARAVWDTGAGITVVDLNFIREHPAFFRDAGQSHGTDSTGARMETPMFVMSGATLGNHAFPPHTVAGVDLSRVNATIETPMDVILGFSTLSRANWWFDFPRRRWAVTKLFDRR